MDSISQLMTLLGCRCEADTESPIGNGCLSAEKQQALVGLFDLDDSETSPQLCFPSFSLDTTQQRKNNTVQTKEEVQSEASTLLSRPIMINISDESADVARLPQMMLENLYSSFDRLVDARILAYSKILSGHGLSLQQCHANDQGNTEDSLGARVLEYKLRTLLEIGTNIHSNSVITSFVVGPDELSERKEDEKTIVSKQIQLKVTVQDLQLPCTDTGKVERMDVNFRANGKIEGTFQSQNSKLLNLVVDVDCNELLSSMVGEASKVVSTVVDLTNEAWSLKNDSLQVPTSIECRTSNVSPRNKVVSPEVGSTPVAAAHGNDIPFIPLDLDHYSEVDEGDYDGDDDDEFELDGKDPDTDSGLSSANVTAIVDFVIGELDDKIICQPPRKKLRTMNFC